MKFNTNMLVDMTANTLQYVPVGGNILKYRNDFSKPVSNQYSYPPYKNGTVLADGYQEFKNTDADTCKTKCSMNPQCNHYYTYNTKDGDTADHCVINLDGSLPKYLPKNANSGINTSNLFTRQKYISSDCKINTYQPTYSSNLGTTDQYNSFQSFTYGNVKYDPNPSSEGACGVDSIAKNLNLFEYGSMNPPASASLKEGFASGAGGATTTPGVISGTKETPIGLSEITNTSTTTAPFVPGFNPNICNSLNKQACLNDMQSNLTVLNSYYDTVNRSQNQEIFKNYSNLQKQIYTDFIKKYNEINANPEYDAIDSAGVLLDKKHEKSLLSGMIYDIKQNMMNENTRNILINLLSASVFVAILALAP
jgi:hypothetical protein